MVKPNIELFDSKNVLRVKLDLEGEDENPKLSFFDKNGDDVFTLGIRDDGCCWISIVDPGTKDAAGFGVSSQGPMLMLHSNGMLPAVLAYAGVEKADIVVCDKDGLETGFSHIRHLDGVVPNENLMCS